jgi:hypothetical protein
MGTTKLMGKAKEKPYKCFSKLISFDEKYVIFNEI